MHLGMEGRKHNSNSTRESIYVSEFDPLMKTTKMQEELISIDGSEALKDMIEKPLVSSYLMERPYRMLNRQETRAPVTSIVTATAIVLTN